MVRAASRFLVTLIVLLPALASAADPPGEAAGQRAGSWLSSHLPPIFLEWQIFEVQLWQWIGIAIALAAALLLGYFVALLLRLLLQRLSAATRWRWDELVVRKMRGPFWIALAVLVFVIELPFLNLTKGPHDLLLGGARLLAILALGWFLIRIIDAVGEQVFTYFKTRGDDMGMAMVPVARKILKPIIIAIIAVVVLQNAGMNVGGLLAGLGIGGLAIALAGKNTLENLFGSIVISFDRPFRIGDWVKVGDIQGTVEDLGLRSTRLRTLDRSLVTIPNAQMADAKVENFSRRDRMKLQQTITLQPDAAPDQLVFIVDEAKRWLLAHPRIWQERFSVNVAGIGTMGFEIELLCWVATTEANELIAVREALLVELARIVDRAGAVMMPAAQPSSRKVDPERSRQAAATVAARRAAGELTVPEIPEAVRQALRPVLGSEHV
jgi:MscS family membrane protein